MEAPSTATKICAGRVLPVSRSIITGTLQRHAVTISMDGKGRYMDNIFVERLWRSLKYEEVVCCERLVSA